MFASISTDCLCTASDAIGLVYEDNCWQCQQHFADWATDVRCGRSVGDFDRLLNLGTRQ